MSYMPWYTVTKQSNKCKSIGCSKCQAGWNPRLMKFNQCHHSDATKPVVQLFAETRFVSENISDVTFNIFHITDNRTVYAYFRRFVVYFFINDMSYCSKLSPTWRPILFKAGIRGHELVNGATIIWTSKEAKGSRLELGLWGSMLHFVSALTEWTSNSNGNGGSYHPCLLILQFVKNPDWARMM